MRRRRRIASRRRILGRWRGSRRALIVLPRTGRHEAFAIWIEFIDQMRGDLDLTAIESKFVRLLAVRLRSAPVLHPRPLLEGIGEDCGVARGLRLGGVMRGQ